MVRLAPGKSEGSEAAERLGKPEVARPDGCLMWLITRDGRDAGGVLSICKELSFLREEPVHCLVTTESDRALVPAVADGVIHQLTPVDTHGSIARFLDHWRPDIGIVLGEVESTRLVVAAAKRDVPFFYVARERGVPHRVPGYLRHMQKCLAGSAAEARWLRTGVEDDRDLVEITGPLKDTVHAPGCNEAECDALVQLLGGRPVWLAAGLQPSEFPLIEAAHRRAFRAAHRLLLILVPDDPDTGTAARDAMEAAGWRTALRSDGGEPDEEVQVYIADTEGEMGLWYRLAPTSFMGGTFWVEGVACDPFDPASLGSAVLHGPEVGEVASRYLALAEAGGAMEVKGSEDLGEAVQSLLAPDRAAALAQAGWAVTTESAGVVERLVEVMDLALLDAETP